jgi:hypothetical protein
MSSEIDAIRELRQRVALIAKNLNLNVNVFNLMFISDTDVSVQIMFDVLADAVKPIAVIEQEKFDEQFAELEKQFTEPTEEAPVEISNNILDDLKKWME